jgi:hypothetical protein
MAFEIAKHKANVESRENKEPIAVIEEAGEFKTKNAFAAYAAGDVVRDVVSTYQRTSAE